MSLGRLHVVWEGDFGGPGSIAHVNRELVRRIARRVEVSVAPEGSVAPDAEFVPFVGRPLKRVDIVMRHSSTATAAPPRAGRWVWMTPWEHGASLPVDWLRAMQHDAAIVCANSQWTGRMFVQSGIPEDRVAVTPNGVDTSWFHPAAVPTPLPVDKRFKFLYVGRLVHRKGLEIALAAYRQVFSSADDVALVIKPCEVQRGGRPLSAYGIDRLFGDSGAPSVTVLPVVMNAADLPGLYTACDALIHPYRGESFCLPMAEAMACGLPVIGTDRGGASMFATSDTATLVTSSLVHWPRLSLGVRRLSNFPHWQEPSVESLAAAMRRAYDAPEAARPAAVRARRLIAERFTWDHAAEVVERTFEAAMRTLPPMRTTAPSLEERETWLDQAHTHLRAGELDAAADAYHRCLGRAVLLADRANGGRVASHALDGLGRIARCRGRDAFADRFFRWASKLSRPVGATGLSQH